MRRVFNQTIFLILKVCGAVMGLFFVDDIYVRVFRNRFVLSIPVKNVLVEEVGDFSHPRMLVGHFQLAEKLLQAGLKKAYAGSFLPPRPVLIMHPKEMLEGGLTDIEERVLRELGLGAGAREVKIWLGDDLDAEGLKNFRRQK